MKTQIARWCLFLFLLILTAGEAFSQTATGNLTGIVMDQSQAVLPNAKVTVINQATALTRETFTNALGEYRVALLPIKIYSLQIKISKKDY